MIPKKISRYDVLEEIGRGNMGVVYRATDPMIGRDVAIKLINVVFRVDPSRKKVFMDRFFHEAKSAGKLAHPNIITVYDVGEIEVAGAPEPFIVMEYFPGRDLSSFLDDGLPDPETVRRVGVQLGGALDYAHRQGVVHRDIKPANVLLGPGPAVKIVDFGIAKVEAPDLTATGELMGTPGYMSPELFSDGTIDGRSDLFSLGVILYYPARPFIGPASATAFVKYSPSSNRLHPRTGGRSNCRSTP